MHATLPGRPEQPAHTHAPAPAEATASAEPGSAARGGTIRVAVLDDHPAVLAGLHRLIERADGMAPVGLAQTQEELRAVLDAASADVVVVDYDLARGDGLGVCLRLKERARPPRVVVYSAYAGPALGIASHLAGADALVHKSEPVGDLLDAIHRVARDEVVLPAVPVDIQRAAMQRLRDDDVAVASMLLAGTRPQAIAETLELPRREVVRRARRIVASVTRDARPRAQTPVA